MPKNIEQFGAEQKKKNSEVLKFSDLQYVSGTWDVIKTYFSFVC